MKAAPSPATFASETNKDRTAREDLPTVSVRPTPLTAGELDRLLNVQVGRPLRADHDHPVPYRDPLPFPVPPPCPVCGDPGPCQCTGDPMRRPAEPDGEATVWYRGWEVSYDGQSAYAAVFGDGRWTAYKGGCDLGAPEVRASSYQACLDAIDEEEEL